MGPEETGVQQQRSGSEVQESNPSNKANVGLRPGSKLGTLTREQYHQWKLYLDALLKAQLKAQVEFMRMQILDKDAGNLLLKRDLQKFTVTDSKNEVQEIEKEFKDVKKKIEEELGYSLEKVSIDENTLVVTQL